MIQVCLKIHICGCPVIVMWCVSRCSLTILILVPLCVFVHVYIALPNHNAHMHNYECICNISTSMDVSFTLQNTCMLSPMSRKYRNLMWCSLSCLSSNHLCLGDIKSGLFRVMRQSKFCLDKNVALSRLYWFTWTLLPTSWPTRKFAMVSKIECGDKRSVVELLDWQIASDILTTTLWAFMSCSRQFKDLYGTRQCQTRVDKMKMCWSEIMKA